MKRSTVLASLVCGIILQTGSVIGAENLLVNGGFELGFAGWLGTYGYMTDPNIAVEGRNLGIIIDVTQSSVGQPMYQPITTVPGTQYTFSFDLLSGWGRIGESSPGNAPVAVYWGDQRLGVFSNPSTTTWQAYRFQTTATSSSTTITFRDDNDPHWQLIDDVRVVAVPEPAPIAILGGIGVVALWRWRRKLPRTD